MGIKGEFEKLLDKRADYQEKLKTARSEAQEMLAAALEAEDSDRESKKFRERRERRLVKIENYQQHIQRIEVQLRELVGAYLDDELRRLSTQKIEFQDDRKKILAEAGEGLGQCLYNLQLLGPEASGLVGRLKLATDGLEAGFNDLLAAKAAYLNEHSENGDRFRRQQEHFKRLQQLEKNAVSRSHLINKFYNQAVRSDLEFLNG